MIRPLLFSTFLPVCLALLLNTTSGHAQSAAVSIGSGGGIPGETFTVSVSMTNDTGVAGFQFAIFDSLNAVDIDTVIATSRVTGAGLTLSFNRVNPTITNVIAFVFGTSTVASGSGSVVDIIFRVRSDALSGTHPLQLRSVVLSDDQSNAIPTTVTNGTITITGGIEPDVTPPAAPTGLTATADHQRVVLGWNANTESDLAYYAVFRTTGNTSVPGDSIARIRTPRTDYTDLNLTNDIAYTYHLVAVDSSGNKSNPSASVSATPVDMMPPKPPVGLQASGSDRRVSLSWLPNTETDLASYIILRRLVGNIGLVPDSIATVPAAVTTYADTGLVNGTTYRYQIAAVDDRGNKSSPSLPRDGTPQAVPDTTAPAVPKNVTAVGGDRRIELRWQPGIEQDRSHYILYRSTQDGFNPSSQDSVARLEHFHISYVDNDLTNGTRYYYRLVAVDFSANRSGPSVQATAVPDNAPLVRNVIPGLGPTTGGTTVLIHGENFQDGATVKFGNADADSVRFLGMRNLTARIPPNTPGGKDVTVTNPSGLSSTLRRGFLYTKVDSFTVVVKVTSEVDGQTRVDTVNSATLPETLPYILQPHINAPVMGLQPLYNALAGMVLTVPPAAVVDNMIICLNIRNVVIRNDSTIFAPVHGKPSFFFVDPVVSINGIEHPGVTFSSLSALHLTLRLGAFNRILQTSGVDSTVADSLAFAYVTDQGLTQEGMISRVRFNERLLVGSLTRLGALAGVRQRDILINTNPAVIVGGPFATPGDTVSLITWRTDKLSTSRAEYGTDASSLNMAVTDTAFVIGHALVLKDLTSRTKYFYRVQSTDSQGQNTTSRIRSFMTGNRPDVIPPSFIVEPQMLTVSRNGAVLGWTTDEKTTGTVEFGTTTDLGRIKIQDRFQNRHVIGLSGLHQNTRYYALISAQDQHGNVTAFPDTITFTTLAKPDSLPPRIVRRPIVTGLTPTSAIIQWRTDEPGNSVVFYQEISREDTLQTSNPDEELTPEHNVNLTGLTANTWYRYAAVSTDGSGNTGRSRFRRFRTPAVEDTVAPVIVRGPTVLYRSNRVIAIGWVTNEVSDGFVFYRGGQDSTFIPRGSGRQSRRHFVIVGGLESGTEYTFAATSTDPSGNTVVFPEGTVVSKPTGTTIRPRILAVTSGEIVVTTTDVPDNDPPVIITGPDVIAQTSTSITLAWETDEPGDSQVLYGTNLGLSATDEDVVTSHHVTLTNLEAGTTYEFQVGSTDPGGNGPTFSATGTATTASTPDTDPPVIIAGSVQTAISHDRITVSWKTNEPSDSSVEYGSTPGTLGNMEDASELVTSHSVVLTNLSPSTTYYLRGASTDLDGNGPTKTATLTVTTTAEADTTRPVISTISRQALATTDTTAKLMVSWRTDILATRRIEYGTTTNLGHTITDETSGTSHTITASRLALNTKYFFRTGSASANDPQGDRIAYSGLDSLITPAAVDTTAPQAPESLTSVPGNGAVRIRWAASTSDNVTGYKILRNGTAIATVGTETIYLDVSAVNGQTHTYTVQAISAVGNTSALPTGVSTTPNIDQVPTVPSNGSPATGDTVSLAPTLVVNNATPVSGDANRVVLNYEFQVSDNVDFSTIIASATGISGGTSGNPTNWQIRDSGRPAIDLLENGITYWWRSRANDTEFPGDWSTPTTFVASTAVPTGISLAVFAAGDNRGAVTLDWSIAAGQEPEGFHVMRSLHQNTGFERITHSVVSGTEEGYNFIDHDVEVNVVYYYMLEAVTTADRFGPINIRVTPPNDFTLDQNFPNPFNPSTTIRYELPKQAKVTLKVYNLLGQEVQTLVNETQQAGFHTIIWNGRNGAGYAVASGMYFYRLEAGVFTKAKKMLLLK